MNTQQTAYFKKAGFSLDLVWWYWAATTALLLAVVANIEHSMQAVIILNAIQVIHFIIREKSITAFPVEVRTTYLCMLILSTAPYMVWILWWQLIGTAAMVMFRYCFLARLMSLMPWHLKENNKTFSFSLVKQTFFTAPVDGNIMQGLPAK